MSGFGVPTDCVFQLWLATLLLPAADATAVVFLLRAKDQTASQVFAGFGDRHLLNATTCWYLVFHVGCMAHLEPVRNIVLTLEQQLRIATNKNAAIERKARKERAVLNPESVREMVITPEQKIRIAANKKAAQDRNATLVRRLKKEATRAKNAKIVADRVHK